MVVESQKGVIVGFHGNDQSIKFRASRKSEKRTNFPRDKIKISKNRGQERRVVKSLVTKAKEGFFKGNR